MGLYEAFKLLHRKGNNQLSEKATDELGENHISDKGLTPEYTKNFYNSTVKTTTKNQIAQLQN